MGASASSGKLAYSFKRKKEKIIGEGPNAIVYKAKRKADKMPVAIKVSKNPQKEEDSRKLME